MSDIDEAVRNGWLHKDAEDEIKRLRAERDALAAENSALGKAMQKVRPLNKCEIGAFRAAYSDASMMSRFRDAMAARGIEVEE